MNAQPPHPMRILHVLGALNRGGVETWLLEATRHLDRNRYAFDFLTHTDAPCAYDDEIRAMGCRISSCLHPQRPWRYLPCLREYLAAHGPYAILHSHVHHFSGLVLRAARQAGIPGRIAHSHNDTRMKEAGRGWIRRAYLRWTEREIRRHATAGFACSQPAARALFGPEWQTDARWQVLPYGLDVERFLPHADDRAIRTELQLAPDDLVIGHIGRFVPQKNHEFLLDILACLHRREPRVKGLLIGDGPLRPAITEKIQRLGLSESVIVAGARADVPRLLRGAMDYFLFPSRFEGLGLVLVEAQAAGLPCLVSQSVPDEARLLPAEQYLQLSLDTPAHIWAQRILAMARPTAASRAAAWARVAASPYQIHQSMAALTRVYDLATPPAANAIGS